MQDRGNWERERMRDRGHEGDREHLGRGREDWRESERERDRERDPQQFARDNRQWDREGRYVESEERYGNEGRFGDEENSGRGYRPTGRGDYGPGAFTRQFRSGNEYFGTGQRGYGTTWGGSQSYGGGAGSYGGGVSQYSEQGQYAGRGPKGYQRSDERIREDVCERLTQHPHVDASEINIQVNQGEVTLTGTVERREEKRMAEDIAESVSGVKDVHNQLRMHQQGMSNSESKGTLSNTRESAPQKSR